MDKEEMVNPINEMEKRALEQDPKIIEKEPVQETQNINVFELHLNYQWLNILLSYYSLGALGVIFLTITMQPPILQLALSFVWITVWFFGFRRINKIWNPKHVLGE